jgi:biotin carboxylase
MSNKNLMILGAGVYQVPLIKKAREMGFNTIVLSKDGNYPGIEIADIFFAVDTTNADEVLSVAKGQRIMGIVTTGTDVCVPSIGNVIDKLNLSGTGYEASKKSMNKVLMKNCFWENNVPTAEFGVFDQKNSAIKFAKKIGYPVMVKATDSSGSRGITKVNTYSNFDAAWNEAIEISRSKQVIVEEYLNGLEFGAQAVIYGDEVKKIFLHGDVVTEGPYFTPVGHYLPIDIEKKVQDEAVEVINRAVTALGLRDCISNVDLMFVNGAVKVIEIAARMGATCLPENVAYYSGLDIYKILINLSIGKYEPLNNNYSRANASILLKSQQTGTLSGIKIPKSILDHPDLLDLKVDVKVGSKVKKFKTGPDRIGHCIVKSETAFGAIKLLKTFEEKISFKVKPN